MDPRGTGREAAGHWVSAGGEMGALIRAHDWARTPLGEPESWPEGLRTSVGIMLEAICPMGIYWGGELVLLYNDPWRRLIGDKHPSALGRPAHEVFPEAWDTIGPMLEQVLSGGGAAEATNQLLPLDRHGGLENAWFDFTFNPIPAPDGSVAGILNLAIEITERTRAEAALREREVRQAFLLELSDRLRQLADPVVIQYEASRALGEHLGANRVAYCEDEGDGRTVVVTRNYTDGLPPLEGRFRYDTFDAALLSRFERGEVVVHDDVANSPLLGEAEKAAQAGIGIGASVAVPLVKDGRLVAVLFVHFREAHAFTAEELLLAEAVAERTWAALQQARAEGALRGSEERHRLIVDGARDYAIITTDPEGLIESWSPGAESIYGWSAQEITGKPVDVTFTPEDRAERAPEWEMDTARREGSAPDVRWHLTRDGGRVFIDGVTRPLHGPAGELRGFLKVGQDVTERRRMMETLRELNETLEKRVAERTSELADTNDALREVLHQLVTAEEDERWRISRELHDSMGQLVTGLMLGLRSLQNTASRGEDASRIGGLAELADRIARDVQRMAVDLRPPALDNLGLQLALESHVEEWSARHGIEASHHFTGMEGVRLPREMEMTLYRVVQEGLTNVLKHAQATHVGLVVERRGGMVTVILEDDGCGFDVEETLASREKAQRVGLRGIQERVALVGGELELESSPGGGTTLYVRVPEGTGFGQARREGTR